MGTLLAAPPAMPHSDVMAGRTQRTVVALALMVCASCDREPSPASSEKRRASSVDSPRSGASAAVRPGDYRMSARGLERIRKSEAFVSKVYDDGVGNETVGYGHMLRPGESYAGDITVAQAETLFAEDVSRIVDRSLERIRVPLTQNQVDALGSFIYNVGPGNFARSVLPALNDGDHERATTAMARYTKGRNQRTGERMAMRGLERRRREEVALYKAPAGSASLSPPGRYWSRVTRRLLATKSHSSRLEHTCFLEVCGRSDSPS